MRLLWSDRRDLQRTERRVTRDQLQAAYRELAETDAVQAAGAVLRWWERSSAGELEELEELRRETPAPSSYKDWRRRPTP